MRSSIDSLVTEKSLSLVHLRRNSNLLDLIDSGAVKVEAGEDMIKNVCCKVHVSISDEIDEIVGILGVSKRRFLEAALVDAIASARDIMDKEGVWDAVAPESDK